MWMNVHLYKMIDVQNTIQKISRGQATSENFDYELDVT